jgi:predicted O-methyltransferase YrrM
VKIKKAGELLDGIPHIEPVRARELYNFVLESGSTDILELGTAHGTSTCWMAAALDERSTGNIVTLDLQSEDDVRDPNLRALIPRTGLGAYITPVLTERSYLWELMKLVEENTVDGACTPIFDFCFIDGAHTWDVDGFAFFLVDKLLRVGGWMLFDDLHWTLDGMYKSMGVAPRGEPARERSTAQVGKIFGLLVCQHPSYGNVRVDGDWGWAQKTTADSGRSGDATVLEKIYGTSLKRDAYLLGKRAAWSARQAAKKFTDR